MMESPLLPYFVCHPAGQTGVTGDKGQTGEKGITGDAGEFEETPCTLFQETLNSLLEHICISSSVLLELIKIRGRLLHVPILDKEDLQTTMNYVFVS